MSELLTSKGVMSVDNMTTFSRRYQGQMITSYKIDVSEKQFKDIESELDKYINDPGTYSLLG
jgi:hypothetical protein